MTNPQDNPGTPPPPTPSNSSTSPPPSTSPKPRLRRVKMLAQNTVASGALSKKLNEKLKASQVHDSDSTSDFDSYKSAKIVEESGKKSGGSGSGEAAEGLVNLSVQGDEPGSSTEETLADLLKKVGGRATRSRVKQSESDLQKALAESKKKRMAKGKGKVAESSEVVEVEEMEQVHQEEVPTVEDLVEPGIMRPVDALAAQGWKDMVLQMDGRLARNEIIEFMANAEVKDGKEIL
ncbi:PREDICTED: ena/VASP-like protein [Nicotiana attenuata]|uniref:ena/VASP-like protein n=1 Tax=Nicotiana attenuata TaxID=49451 RepID=UPI0009056E1D|nr:PREDICTED: ena/VASP-like protein [Nicotiana attenuata]